MEKRSMNSGLFLGSLLILALTACSGGGGGGGSSSPYPDPSNPSAFPTQSDSLEGAAGDNTPATATAETIGDTSYHTIYPRGDVDWIKLNLTAGNQYEFTVDNVSYNGLPYLQLYNSDGTTPVTFVSGVDDSFDGYGYFSFNPRLTFTPSASGTYFAKIFDVTRGPGNTEGGVFSYTFSSRIFSSADLDDNAPPITPYSSHYDCNDTDSTIYPFAVDTAGDGIDQSCSGFDWLVSATPDPYEPDNNFSTTGSIPMLGGDAGDIIHRQDVYAKTHTIHVGDYDMYQITVPANSLYDIVDIEHSGTPLRSVLYDSSQTQVDFTGSGNPISYTINNTSNAAVDYYLKVSATDNTQTATYVLGIGDNGTDADHDGHWTKSQGLGWDCNDSDPTINGSATETPNDGIDSNCNGKDNT